MVVLVFSLFKANKVSVTDEDFFKPLLQASFVQIKASLENLIITNIQRNDIGATNQLCNGRSNLPRLKTLLNSIYRAFLPLFIYVEGRKKAKPTVKKTPTNALHFLKV